MASFSYQHLPILDDSDFMASNKSNMSGLLVDQYHHQIDHDQGSNNSNICFPAQFYYPISSDHHHHHHHTTVHGIPVDHIVSSGIIMNKSENTTSCDIVDDQQQNNTSIMTTKTYCTLSSDDNEPLSSVVTKKHSTTDSSTLVDKLGESSGEQVTQKLMAKNSTERKRKITRNGSSSINSAQSKDAREKGRGKKQKNGTGSEKEEVKKVKVNNGKNDETNNKKGQEEPPTGYIHVRARRGQATDSHSLAERARREKISERMKMLQRLVPGCEKVTGKAIMLDEIINYVQSLQNQVEFLSMKLASLNPMFYDFGMDIDAFVVRPEGLNAMASQIQSMPQCSQAQPTAFTTDNNNHQILMDTSASLVLQQGQRPNAFSHDNVSLLWDMEDQRQSFNLNPSGFSNLWSFN